MQWKERYTKMGKLKKYYGYFREKPKTYKEYLMRELDIKMTLEQKMRFMKKNYRNFSEFEFVSKLQRQNTKTLEMMYRKYGRQPIARWD